MYPDIPYSGLSWPITQHAGVVSKDALNGLLNACILCQGKKADASIINDYLVKQNILTENVRADSNQIDAWRDYQQILSEFGLIYSTRLSKEIQLTPVAFAYLNGKLNYKELILFQVIRYQYPNGHKSQLSPSLTKEFGTSFPYSSFTELQAHYKVHIHPAIITWSVMYQLWMANELSTLSIDEMQNYVMRCIGHSDVTECVAYIIKARKKGIALSPLARARRNAADWMKVLNQTPLFTLDAERGHLALSAFSIKNSNEILKVAKELSEPSSFWIFDSQTDYKKSWFDYYGDFDNNLNFVIKA